MAKIVYGVSGEGSGHSSRSSFVIKHLLSKGHTVKVATYDRGIKNLTSDFDVTEVEGLAIITEDNRVSKSKTLAHNLAILSEGQNKHEKMKKELFKEFDPDLVITDFEPQTAYLANLYNIPLITIDNQHRMRYLEYDYPFEMKADAILIDNIIRAMIPRPDYSIITSFYSGKLKYDRCYLTPPILRKEIVDLKPKVGNHLLVYLTRGYESILDLLKEFKREEFIIYGYNEKKQDKNLTFKMFSKEGFLHDLANCKGLIGTSGFTLMTEGFYLAKPYLGTPMKGQFEQELNSYILEKMGFGRSMTKLSKTILGSFLYEIPDFHEKLRNYNHCGNKMVTEKLDELLANNLAKIKEFHKLRTINYKIESIFGFLDFHIKN